MSQLDGLVAYYKFNEVSGPAIEAALGMRNLVLQGTEMRVPGVYTGSGLASQAAGDRADADELRAWRVDPGTVACFVKFNALPSAGTMGSPPIILVSLGDGLTEGYFLGVVSGDTLIFRVVDTAGSIYQASYTVQPSDVGEWRHIMGVLTSNTSVQLYVDNTLVDTAVVGGFLKFNPGMKLTVGRNLDGTVDEVKIWSRPLPGGDRAIAHEEIEFPPHISVSDYTLSFLDNPIYPFGEGLRQDHDRYVAIRTTLSVVTSDDGYRWSDNGVAVPIAPYALLWNDDQHLWYLFGTAGRMRTAWDISDTTWAAPAAFAWDQPICAGYHLSTMLLGATDALYRSSNSGNSWTSVPSIGMTVHGVLYLEKYSWWVAVGSGSKISTSPNAVTWTARTNAATGDFSGVAYGPELDVLIAIVDNGQVARSVDGGVTWAISTPAITGTPSFIAYSARRFVIVSDNDMIISLDGGQTWDAAVYPLASAPVGLVHHTSMGRWFLASSTQVATSGDGETWEVETVDDPILSIATQPSSWKTIDQGFYAVLDVTYIHRGMSQSPMPYTDSPFGMVMLPRNPNPTLVAADLNCPLQEFTAQITYGPTDSLVISRYWEIEMVPNVAYLRIAEEYPVAPNTIDDTQITLSFPTNVGVDLNVKRLRYVIEAEANLMDKVKWTTPWVVISCDGTVIPMTISFAATAASTFSVNLTPYVAGQYFRVEWGTEDDGFVHHVQGQLSNPVLVPHGYDEGDIVYVRAFKSFNGGASYEPLTESNHIHFTVPPSTVVPLTISFASFDYQTFQLNISPFTVGGYYRIEWGLADDPFTQFLEGPISSLPKVIEHGFNIGDDILIRAFQSFDGGIFYEPFSESNHLPLEIPSGGGEALQLQVPTCYIDTFDAILTPLVSGEFYRFEFGEVGVGFTVVQDGRIFNQPANVFHGFPVGTELQIRAYRSYDGGVTFDPDTMSNTVFVTVTNLPNPVPAPLNGGAQIVNIYEPQFTLPYQIERFPGPIPAGFIIDLFWRAAPLQGDPLAPRIEDRNSVSLILAQLFSGRHRYRITMQMSNGYTYAQDYLLLTRAGVKPREV